jgi:ABC-2 type transport system ATP-binding protein
MADVEALCKRVVVIHHGRILFDGQLTDLITRFSPHKTIAVELEYAPESPNYATFGEVITQVDGRVLLRVPKQETPKVASRLLAELPVIDLTIEDPPIEDVIEQVFAQEAAP